MNTLNRFLVSFFAGLALASCITTHSVPIDQMEPGKIHLPAQIRKVALVSRNFKFSIDTLSGYYNLNFRLKKGKLSENQLIDSLAVTKSLEALRKELLESGRFDEVFVYPYKALKPFKGARELPLTTAFIQSVCSESETEAVISLEMLSYFYSRHNGTAGHEISDEANTKVTAIWSVYSPKNNEPIERFTHSEIIRWSENDSKLNNEKYKLPERKEGIPNACGIAAKNYSKRIVPYWTQSSRVLISLDNPDFGKALSYASKNKWKEASGIWEKYSTNPQPRTSGIASLNYAVAQEMLGDYKKAAFYSDKATKLLKNGESGKIARAYAAVLHERSLKVNELNSILNSSHP